MGRCKTASPPEFVITDIRILLHSRITERRRLWIPAITRFARSAGTTSRMQPKLLGRRPGAPVAVRHLNVRGAEERERIIDGVGEARHAADIGTLANALGADRMMGRRRGGPVGFPMRRLDRSRQEIVHE